MVPQSLVIISIWSSQFIYMQYIDVVYINSIMCLDFIFPVFWCVWGDIYMIFNLQYTAWWRLELAINKLE